MNCKVNVRDNGNIEVSGENAPLYYEALSVIGNESDALDIYGVSLTDGFKGLQLKTDLSSVTAYIESNNIEKATYFTPQEVVDIYNAPNYKQFIPSTTVQGKFSLNRENMLNFYSAKEADEILESPTLQRDVHNIWYKMQNSLGALEDISFRDPIVKVVEQEKTVLKKQRVQNIDETYTKVGELAANAKTKEELEEIAIKDDSEVATQVADNLDDVFEEFKDKKALQQYVENQLTGELEKKKYNSTEDRILSTYNVGQNSDSIQDSILLLLSLDEQVIAENKNDVTDLLKSVVEEASDLGLDLVGLETLENGAENTKTFLANLSAFLTNLSTMGQFIESYNTFFNIEEDINRPQIKRISQTNVFSVSSNKSELALFNDKSIVRIKGDVYKKVSRNSENLFEDLYLKALQDPTIFEESVYYPYAFDGGGNFLKERLKNKRYKTEIKENIRKEVENQSRQLQTQEGYSTESLLELTAHKIANKSENTVINKSDYHNFLGNTNEDTFIGNFLVKINKHLIKQKIKGNILPLTFTQNGLELNYQGTYSAFEVVNGLPKGLQQDLITYSKITGNLSEVLEVQPKYYVSNLEMDVDFNRNFYSNFKDQLPIHKGNYSAINEDVVEANSEQPFIKIKNVIYENIQGNIYGRVEKQNTRSWNRNRPDVRNVPSSQPTLTNIVSTKKINTTSAIPQQVKEAETIEQLITDNKISFQGSTGQTTEIIDQLQKTGLAENVYQLSSQEIENKLKEYRQEQADVFQPRFQVSATPTWISNAKEGISKIKQGKATPEQWVKQISDKGGKGTAQELEWIGLQDFLDSYITENNTKSVPKEVVEQYINDNQIEIVEVGKGQENIVIDDDMIASLGGKYETVYSVTFSDATSVEVDMSSEYSNDEDVPRSEIREKAFELRANDDLSFDGDLANDTKYSQYQLEGGENYKEVLLTLPSGTRLQRAEKYFKSGQYTKDYADIGKTWEQLSDYQKRGIAEAQKIKYNIKKEQEYKSSHWDESNILAHVRMNERTLPNGERVMFIEEVQSDIAKDTKDTQDNFLKEIDKNFDNVLNQLIKEGVIEEEC